MNIPVKYNAIRYKLFNNKIISSEPLIINKIGKHFLILNKHLCSDVYFTYHIIEVDGEIHYRVNKSLDFLKLEINRFKISKRIKKLKKI